MYDWFLVWLVIVLMNLVTVSGYL